MFTVGVALVVALSAAAASPRDRDALPTLSLEVAPRVVTPPQQLRITLKVATDHEVFVTGHIRPGPSPCARTLEAEWDRWPDGYNLLEASTSATRAYRETVDQLPPGRYRVCAYLANFDSDRTEAVATATLRVLALNRVLRIGRGVGPWKLGQPFARRQGLLDTSSWGPSPPRGRCRTSLFDADRVDLYRDSTMVAWLGGRLVGVRTSLRGDRSEEGFVIGTTRLTTVRVRYPGRPVLTTLYSRWKDGGSTSKPMLRVTRRTAADRVVELRYWFDRGVLVAIETGSNSC